MWQAKSEWRFMSGIGLSVALLTVSILAVSGSRGSLAADLSAGEMDAKPFSQKIETEIFTSEITITPAALMERDLGTSLVASSVEAARNFARTAHEDAEGEPDYFHTYALAQSWELALQTPDYVSLLGTQWMFTGGAHGNSAFAGLLWRRGEGGAAGREVSFMTLFENAGDADAPLWKALGPYLLDQWEAEWVARTGAALGPDDAVWREDAARTFTLTPDAHMVVTLLPSTVGGKAAGLTFHYAPYALGPYSMGTFAFAVPHTVFEAYLTADAQALFGGEPLATPNND